jgi:hypothetical protein
MLRIAVAMVALLSSVSMGSSSVLEIPMKVKQYHVTCVLVYKSLIMFARTDSELCW